MSKPYVSIIVPAYNSSATIIRCVESIKAQTFTDWELIIADNGSTDGCAGICRQLAADDSRIRVIEVSQRGVSAARNAALDIAQGEYLCFVDSDDEIECDYIELLSTTRSDLTVCGYFVDTLSRIGVRLKSEIFTNESIHWNSSKNKKILIQAFESGFMHLCCNKLFRREIIERHNIRFKPYSVNEDYIFTLAVIQYAETVSVINNPLYHWIRIADNDSGVKSIPDNLLAIYNESHLATRDFFGDDSVADRIAYLSYEMIIYKYYEAIGKGRITKRQAFNKINEFTHNKLVKDAYRAYKPKSSGERLLFVLMKMGLYKTHYFLTQKIMN